MERWGRTKGNWHFLPLRLRLLQSLSEPQPIRTCPWNFALIRPVSRSSTWQGCAVQPRGAKTAANFSAGIAACSLGGNILPPLMEWPWKSGKNGVFNVQSVLGLFSGAEGGNVLALFSAALFNMRNSRKHGQSKPSPSPCSVLNTSCSAFPFVEILFILWL